MDLKKKSSHGKNLEKAYEDSNFYSNARPSYDKDVVKFFLEKLGLFCGSQSTVATVLELGCGTGKFTCVMADLLRELNVRIIASDPLKSMCDKFHENLPEVEILLGAAENIALPSSSIDVVIAASSFQYFANTKALLEIKRVLKSDGKFGVCVLMPDISAEWIKDIWDFLEPLYHEKAIPFAPAEEWKAFIVKSNMLCNAQRKTFRLKKPCTVESVLDNFISYSVIALSSEDEQEKFKTFFRLLIENYFIKKNETLSFLPLVITLDWFENQPNLDIKLEM